MREELYDDLTPTTHLVSGEGGSKTRTVTTPKSRGEEIELHERVGKLKEKTRGRWRCYRKMAEERFGGVVSASRGESSLYRPWGRRTKRRPKTARCRREQPIDVFS